MVCLACTTSFNTLVTSLYCGLGLVVVILLIFLRSDGTGFKCTGEALTVTSKPFEMTNMRNKTGVCITEFTADKITEKRFKTDGWTCAFIHF